MAAPIWFSGIDAALSTVFLIVTLLVAIVAYRGYRFFKETRYLRLAEGFGLLAAGYLALALSHLLVFLELHEATGGLEQVMEVSNTIIIGFLIYAVLFLGGLVLLLFLYLRIEDRTSRLLILTLVLFAFILAGRMTSAFYVLVALLLLFIIVRLAHNWHAKRTAAGLLILAGMVLVFIGEVLFATLFVHPALYYAADGITLAGYLLVLFAQVRR